MAWFDIGMFIMIAIWLFVIIRAGKRINRPIFIVIYWMMLVLKRLGYEAYYAATRKPKTPQTEDIDDQPVQSHPYEISLGKLRRRGKELIVNVMGKHTLIGATSGGGKTYMLHSILKQLFDKGSLFFDNTDVYLIDLKGHPDDMLHLWKPLLTGYATRVGGDMEDALQLLANIEARLGEELERKILLIIDEVHILTSDKEGDRLLQNVSSQLRLNGSLILLVQHSQYAIVKTFIRYNIERRICGLVMSRDQARVILDIRPKQEELPQRVGEYLIREPGKTELLQTTIPMMNLPDDIRSTIDNVIRTKSEDMPEMRLLIDVIGNKKFGDTIVGVKTIKSTLGVPNAQNFAMVAYRNYTNAGIFDPPRVRGGKYKLAVADLREAINRFQEYLPNWKAAPDPFVDGREDI